MKEGNAHIQLFRPIKAKNKIKKWSNQSETYKQMKEDKDPWRKDKILKPLQSKQVGQMNDMLR